MDTRSADQRGGTAVAASPSGAVTIAVVIFDTLTLGFITLGFEMLAGRLLTPLFGSGIYTWATIISLVVAGLMFGYFIGGFFADRYPSYAFVAIIKIAAGLYMLLVWYIAGGKLEAMLSIFSDEIAALFASGFVVCFPPLLVLGMYSPLAVRLLLADPHSAGRVSGAVFAVSSFGNIVGILVTTFFLIPTMGSRAITLSYAVFLLASGVLSILAELSLGGRPKVPA